MNVDITQQPLRTLSVCSGIGGLELGVSRAIHTRVVGYCEREAFAASVLLARMEETALDSAPLWVGDIREMDADSLAGEVELYIGGFPCQPYSQAGKRKASDDERDLWATIREHLRVIRPRYAFFENVRGLVSHREGLERVLCDLARLGFDARWTTLKAAAVGAPHHRERLFIMAYANGGGCEGSGVSERAKLQGSHGSLADGRGSDGRLSGEAVAHPGGVSSERRRKPRVLASEGRQAEGEGDQRQRGRDSADHRSDALAFATEFALAPDRDWSGVPDYLLPALDAPKGLDAKAESVLRGKRDGNAQSLLDAAQLYRIPRLRALGNAVVPSQAEAAFRYLFPHPELLKQS